MEKKSKNMKNEVDRGKYNQIVEKCNLQVKKIKEQESYIKELESHIENLSVNENDKFNIILMAFYKVIEYAIKNGYILEPKNRTKINLKYCSINYNVIIDFLDNYIEKIDKKNIIKWWGELGFLFENEKNGTYVVNSSIKGKTVRCLKIKKSLIDMIKIFVLDSYNEKN